MNKNKTELYVVIVEEDKRDGNTFTWVLGVFDSTDKAKTAINEQRSTNENHCTFDVDTCILNTNY